MKAMLIIGIAGGVACGKSTVTNALADLGAAVIDADAVGHEVLQDPAVLAAAVDRWGEAVLAKDGTIAQQEVAQRVFGSDPRSRAELEFWENCTHPRIAGRLSERIEQFRHRTSPPPAVVLDAAVMFKAGWDRFCDRIVYVDAPRAIRRARALSRGWTAAQFAARERSQVSVQEKRRQSDFVVDNSGTLDQTYEQVLCLWHSLSGDQP